MAFLKLVVYVIGFGIALLVARLAAGGREHGSEGRGRGLGVSGVGVILGLAIVVLTLAISASFGQVPAGFRGVVLRFGAPTGTIKGEGLYMVTPFINTVELMSVQVVAYEAIAEAASRDLQDVKAKVTLNYSLDALQVVDIYRRLRQDYEVRIIKPAIQEAVKAATARFTAEELITRRPEVRDAIQRNLEERLVRFHIRSEAMSITDFAFSKSFNEAIEAKVTATQQVLKAERDLQRVRLEAQQQIEQARAQAEALRIQKENVTAQLVELRKIEAQMRAIEKWNGAMPTYVAGPFPILDVFNSGKR
ncbi:MAG: prohibitin family protein [Armatimonadetes bacterium]|nr:prohibitin family protein [Armatimonadota bacterium]